MAAVGTGQQERWSAARVSQAAARTRTQWRHPTNGRFPFYELEQRGVIPKKYDGVNPRTGKNYARTPLQDVSVCDHAFARSWPRAVALDRGTSYPQPVVMELCRQRRRLCQGAVDRARIDLWQDEEPPLIICESRCAGATAMP